MKQIEWLPKKDSQTTVDMLISAIRGALESGQLKPGDRMPSENELSVQMSISRGSVREAMKVLSAYGVVEIFRGNGTYIAQNESKLSLDPILFNFILTQPSLHEIEEYRYCLENIVIQLALQNRTDQDLEALRENIEELRRFGKSPEETTRIDLEFHYLLGKCTKNRLIERTYQFAMEYFSSSVEKTHRKQERLDETIEVHELTYSVVRDKDVEKIPMIVGKTVRVWTNLSYS